MPFPAKNMSYQPHHVPTKMKKKLHGRNISMQFFLFFNQSFSFFYISSRLEAVTERNSCSVAYHFVGEEVGSVYFYTGKLGAYAD